MSEYTGKWQVAAMICHQCLREWVAVFPVCCERIECPECHQMSPTPAVPESELAG
jgi:hypothetical protein